MFSRQQIVAIVSIVSMVSIYATVAAAHVGTTVVCSGEYTGLWPDAGFDNSATASIYAQHESRPSQRTVPVAIPAGTYQVTAVSYDGYDDRTFTEPLQELEQFFLQFLAADGSVLASTGPTGDLLDGQEEDEQSFAVGEVTLSAPAVAVSAVHLYHGQGVGTQGVMPACFGVLETSVTTTTTAPTTTAPTTTALLTTAPLTTAPPTTAVPAQVLPEVEVADPAGPVNATPSFTG